MTRPASSCTVAAAMFIMAGGAQADGGVGWFVELARYAQEQGTTSLLVVQDGHALVDARWPLGPDDQKFQAMFVHGSAPDGSLLEDVASQQKSFIAVLVGIAVDRGLIDVSRPVSSYLGGGWSKASPEQVSVITVLNLLQMNTGLREDFSYETAAGAQFRYNTAVYASLKKILESASSLTLEQLTRRWLTEPLGMTDTGWRQRPDAMPDVGNPTGLVTTARDEARFGQMVLDRGRAADGRQVISQVQLDLLFEPSLSNPAYGRLWWLNGSGFVVRASGERTEGPLIPGAPVDLRAALGFADRRLYVVPSQRLVVVRLGRTATDKAFDEQLWTRLSAALNPRPWAVPTSPPSHD